MKLLTNLNLKHMDCIQALSKHMEYGDAFKL